MDYVNPNDGKESPTDVQKASLRRIFEPKYGRILTDEELWEIHFNLKSFLSPLSKPISITQ